MGQRRRADHRLLRRFPGLGHDHHLYLRAQAGAGLEIVRGRPIRHFARSRADDGVRCRGADFPPRRCRACPQNHREDLFQGPGAGKQAASGRRAAVLHARLSALDPVAARCAHQVARWPAHRKVHGRRFESDSFRHEGTRMVYDTREDRAGDGGNRPHPDPPVRASRLP